MSTARLHVIYRSYGGENTKGRPSFHGKLLALASLLRAVGAVGETGATVVAIFVNDGQMPADQLSSMRSAGEILSLPVARPGLATAGGIAAGVGA
jgi:hypothetical protein